MSPTLPMRCIVIDGTERKKYHRKKKPWWTNELSELWKIRSAAEKQYCKIRVAIILRGNYVSSF